MKDKKPRKVEVEINGAMYECQYEIDNLRDTTFDMTVWYKGESITETCPSYLANPHDDVLAPHGPYLLAKLLEAKGL